MSLCKAALEAVIYFRAIVLLCHKILAPIRRRLSGVEILTRGGGLWVSNPRHVAANHGSPPMSRRSRRRWGTPIAQCHSGRIVRGCCCPAIAQERRADRRARAAGASAG